MDFEDFDYAWVVEVIRSHREATLQIDALEPAERAFVADQLARRQVILGSQAFTAFVQLVQEHRDDLTRYRARQAAPLSPSELAALESAMAERLIRLRENINSFKLLLAS